MKVKFQKGKQKEFLELVRIRLRSPSLRAMLQFGFSTTESALKNYSTERRLLPQGLFEEMLHLAHLNKEDFEFALVEDSWGQVIGGKKSKKN